jgi:hypothetical protein
MSSSINDNYWYQQELGNGEFYWVLNIALYSNDSDYESKNIELSVLKDKVFGWVEGTQIAVSSLQEFHDFITKYIYPTSFYNKGRVTDYFNLSWEEIESNHITFVDSSAEALYKLNTLGL